MAIRTLPNPVQALQTPPSPSSSTTAPSTPSSSPPTSALALASASSPASASAMENGGPAAPTSSAIPLRGGQPRVASSSSSSSSSSSVETREESSSRPAFDFPKLRLEIRDLSHPGASAFLTAVDVGTVFASAVRNVVRHLYCLEDDATSSFPPEPSSPAHDALPPPPPPPPTRPPHYLPPPTRSCTLILRPMDGVAYTTGTDLDDDHKEIHLSLSYVHSIPLARLAHEITGVITHELVHCYQWTGLGTCPGGLVEGVADWVRLQCGLAPPHWSRDDTDGSWDRGYQHTAYFLDYLEERFGPGTVRTINERLRLRKYETGPFWRDLLGKPVEGLWGDYVERSKKGKHDGNDK